MQQPTDSIVAAGFRNLAGQLTVHAGKILTGPVALVQDADEINDRITRLHLHTQIGHRVHVGLHQFEAWDNDQIPISFAAAREHANTELAASQLATKMTSDEPGSAEYAYFSNGHQFPLRGARRSKHAPRGIHRLCTAL